MDWSGLVGTVIGAAVGISSTLVVTQLQWRHQRHDRWYALRRETYVSFLTALNKSYETLWALSLGEYTSELPLAGAAREILRINEVYESRQRALITGSRSVVAACEQAFQSLKGFRDVVGLSKPADSQAFKIADDGYRAAARRLASDIRIDLAVPEPDIGFVTFSRRAGEPSAAFEPSVLPPDASGETPG